MSAEAGPDGEATCRLIRGLVVPIPTRAAKALDQMTPPTGDGAEVARDPMALPGIPAAPNSRRHHPGRHGVGGRSTQHVGQNPEDIAGVFQPQGACCVDL